MKAQFVLVVAIVLGLSAVGADVRFLRPNVIPEPVKLDYREGEMCRLDDASTVRVTCGDKAAAAWIEEKLEDFLKIEPKVERCAQTGEKLGEAAYRLRAAGNVFELEADDLVGIRNAFYTLRMCLMAERGVKES